MGRWVQETLDGHFIVTGLTKSYGAGQNDAWLMKTDAAGNVTWSHTYGGSNNDYGFTVQQILDGGYIISGQTLSFGAGGMDAWLVKTDATGDTVWTSTYGGSMYELGYNAHQASDSGYVLCAQTQSFGSGAIDIWLVKTDSLGDTLWTRTYGGTDQDYGFFVQQTSDGGYILTGLTSSYGNGGYDLFIVKTDAVGDTQWTKTVGGLGDDIGHCIQETCDGGYIIVGQTDSYGAGEDDLWLIKLEPDLSGISPNSRMNVPKYPFLYQNYPNPFNPITTIEFDLPKSSKVILKIFNILGEEVTTLLSGYLLPGSYQYDWDASRMASGVYLYRLEAGNRVVRKKMVLMK